MNSMRTEVIELTPESAGELIGRNTENRKVNVNNLKSLVIQMRNGLWKENGESIIVDWNGIVKNGQHRLMAVIETGISYQAVLVTNVNPDSFETIDTGKTRSLVDLFYINAIPDYSKIATLSKAVFYYDRNRLSYDQSKSTMTIGAGTNASVLFSSFKEIYSFFLKNRKYLCEVKKESARIYKKQPIMVVHESVIGLFIHIIKGGVNKKSSQIEDFIAEVVGVTASTDSPGNFLYRKLLRVRQDKDVKLSSAWIHAVLIKAWNDTQEGVKIKSYRINLDGPMPTINKDTIEWG